VIADLPVTVPPCSGDPHCCRQLRSSWERHGCGDELLYLLAGRALFTAIGAAGTDEVLVEAGDLLVLERDEAHRGRALEDVTVLFLTPRHGNVAWSDKEGVPPLHG